MMGAKVGFYKNKKPGCRPGLILKFRTILYRGGAPHEAQQKRDDSNN